MDKTKIKHMNQLEIAQNKILTPHPLYVSQNSCLERILEYAIISIKTSIQVLVLEIL